MISLVFGLLCSFWPLSFVSAAPVPSIAWGTDRSSGQIQYYVSNNNDSTPVLLSGSSWFGFETQDFVVNGLWNHPMTFYLDTLQNLGINIIRVPFSSEWILYHWDLYPDSGLVNADPESQHKKSIEILDRLFDEASSRGIGIMLDLHRLHKEYISELWYSPTDNQYTAENWFDVWFKMLDYILPRHNNLVAIDLLNEPHGAATWGSDDPGTDWRLFVQGAIPRVADRYSNHHFLFFVEGIEWGHTFEGWHDHQPPKSLNLPDTLLDRIVFSPHTYGSSVVPGTSNDVGTLRGNWNNDFGFLRDLGYPIAVGEWGGRTDIDRDWMNHLVDYLIDKNCTNQFFWSLGPNSGDVAGILLEDWTTVDSFKQGVIQRVVPHPSKLPF